MSEDIVMNDRIFHFESSNIESIFEGWDSALNNEFLKALNIIAIDPDNHSTAEAIKVRHVADHSELENLLHELKRLREPHDGSFCSWHKEVYRGAWSFKLETLIASLLAVIMKCQPVKWQNLTLRYIADIATMTHTFVVDLLRVIYSIERVRVDIVPLLKNPWIEKYKSAVSQIDSPPELELNDSLATLNHHLMRI